MASLTATIDTPTRGKSTVDGEKAGPGIFDAVAEPLSDFISGMGASAGRARQRADDKAKSTTNASKNEAEQLRFDTLKAANQLARTKAAVGQGKAPPGILDLQQEAKIQELYNKFPDNKADVAQYLQERGFNHWMFREAEQARAADDAQNTAQIKGQTDDYDYAVQHGIAHPSKSFEENAAKGARLRLQDEILKRTTEAAANRRAASAEGRAQGTYDQAQQDRDAFGALNSKLQEKLEQFTGPVDAFVAGAIGDSNKERRLAEMLPLMANWIESERGKAKTEAGAALTPELEKMIDQRYDGAKKSLEDRFAGTLSSYQTYTRIESGLQTQLKLSNADSMKATQQLVEMFGREAVAGIFGPNGAIGQIPKETLDKVKQELSGYSTLDASQGRAHMMRVAALLKGQLNLKDMTEAEAMEALPTLAATLGGNQAALLKGDKTPETVRGWQNGYGNLVEATVEIQPGQRNLSSLWAGVQLVASPGARKALELGLSDPDQRETATALMVGSRGSAVHALNVAKDANPTGSPDRMKPREFQTVKFGRNPANGVEEWFVEFDARGFEKKYGNSDLVYNKRLDKYEKNPYNKSDAGKLDVSTRDRISIMNASLTHLVETAKYDSDIPKDATPKAIREHYAKGTPFVKVGGKPMLSSDEEFFQAVDAFEKKLREDPTKPGPSPVSGNIKFSSGTDALVRTLILEAASEGPQGIQAAASVIMNRAGGKLENVESVVLANNGRTWQFTAWGDPKARNRGLTINPDSPEYQKVMEAVAPLLAGSVPRGPYRNYINKDLQAANGDPIPDWAQGEGTKIGAHTFY